MYIRSKIIYIIIIYQINIVYILYTQFNIYNTGTIYLFTITRVVSYNNLVLDMTNSDLYINGLKRSCISHINNEVLPIFKRLLTLLSKAAIYSNELIM